MRKGFTLIELLIVIVIVSLVYFLGFEAIELDTKKPKALTPLNLKENIVSSDLFQQEATLICTDKCRTCYLRRGVSSAFEAYQSPIDLTEIKAYTIDQRDSLVRIEYGRYQDKQICLLMDFYPNGSSTQIILGNDMGSYFLPSFFGEPQTFDSPEEAKDYWLRNSRSVSDNGEFF